MVMKYNICDSPNWYFEAAACISEYYTNIEDKVIKNHKNFGMTIEEMEDFFAKFKSYKKAVIGEILPIYNRYPSLEWLFKPVKYNVNMDECMGVSLISYLIGYSTEYMNDDLIDKVTLEFVFDVLSDIFGTEDAENLKIEGISDLVNVLENNNINDDIFKMHLIRLYHARYKTIRDLWEMLNLCVPILKKHYDMIEDHVQMALQALPSGEGLERILKVSAGLYIRSNLDCTLYPTIYFFNRIKYELNPISRQAYVGIYVLQLINLKEKNEYMEDELVKDLKALGDPTRFKIIRILLEREMYLKELAEEINLTSATVSHHIDILQKSNLISVTIGDDDGRKVLFDVNREKLKSIGDSINRLSYI